MKQKRRPGAPKGSKNRQIGPFPRSTNLHIRCTPDQKDKWVKQAAARGMTLSEWVHHVLEIQG